MESLHQGSETGKTQPLAAHESSDDVLFSSSVYEVKEEPFSSGPCSLQASSLKLTGTCVIHPLKGVGSNQKLPYLNCCCILLYKYKTECPQEECLSLFPFLHNNNHSSAHVRPTGTGYRVLLAEAPRPGRPRKCFTETSGSWNSGTLLLSTTLL